MKEYYFLFALAFAWTLFAVIQDLKKREVANWLNFSFITFALSYRAFFSVTNSNFKFFLFGILGFAIFFAFAHLFYYSKVFAGGDAKLLMAYGIILPYTTYSSLIYLTISFLFTLMLVGAIYSLLYSISIVIKNKTKFKKEFKKIAKKYKYVLFSTLSLFIILILYSLINPLILLPSILLLTPLIYIYTKSLDKCMIALTPYNRLTEGDWLIFDVKLGKIKIKKTVHGLSQDDIKILKKYKKNVLIKQGIPFTPAFLISLGIMVFVFLVVELSLAQLFSALF